jgi:hypothetical protein
MKYHMEYLMDAFFQNLIKFRIKYVLAKLARQLCAPKHVTTLFLTRCEHNANLNNNRYWQAREIAVRLLLCPNCLLYEERIIYLPYSSQWWCLGLPWKYLILERKKKLSSTILFCSPLIMTHGWASPLWRQRSKFTCMLPSENHPMNWLRSLADQSFCLIIWIYESFPSCYKINTWAQCSKYAVPIKYQRWCSTVAIKLNSASEACFFHKCGSKCEGPEKAIRGGWMRANKNSPRELGLYPKINLSSLSTNSGKTAQL